MLFPVDHRRDHRRFVRLAAPVSLSLTLLVAACGGTPSSGASASPTATAVAFSVCMRSHGLAAFPDPGSDGTIPKVTPQQLGVAGTTLQAAERACRHLLRPSTGQLQDTLQGMRGFARCMRSHGVPNWPDPTLDAGGQPVFDLHGRVDPDVRPATSTADVCSHRLRPPPGSNGVQLCNGIGEPGCHHYG